MKRKVNISEALATAVRLQRSGQLDEAGAFFEHILEAAPDHPGALHYAGVLAHQQGRSEEAVTSIRRSLEVAPHQPDVQSNLGIILKALGRHDEAVAAYRTAIAIDPAHPNAHSNLGLLLKMQGEFEAAEEAYRTAIHLEPTHVDAHNNLGALLASRGRAREAVNCFCRALTCNPVHRDSRRRLAMAHATLGELDQAVAVLEAWVTDEPENSIARHMLAASSGRNVPERASDAFVEETFDSFADHFDESLSRLRYQAPAIVAALLEDSGLERSPDLDVLDAGCGTGLCGPLVAPYARRLVGVDLSNAMLARAQARNVYHELVHAELTAYLVDHPAAFDIIVCADTLVYFGVLDAVVEVAAKALRAGGTFIFTIEEDEEGTDFVLRPHGRYAHAGSYLERVLAGANLRAEIAPVELRMEAGLPVGGLAVIARRA